MQYSVIIPAYQEQTTIEEAVRQTLLSLSFLAGDGEIIVVDDGSRDATALTVKTFIEHHPGEPVRLISLPVNQGKGAAIKAGVEAAKGDVIAFLDADLATHPDELKKGFSLLQQADIAIASRRVDLATIKKPQPWYRSWTGQGFNLFLRLFFGLPYRDTQCGCKVFHGEVAKTLFTELVSTGWTFDVELLVRAKRHGFTVCEFPVSWHNGPITRVKWRHAFGILMELVRIKRLT